MTDFIVTWRIDIEADTPEEAAQAALKIQRYAKSIATIFEVTNQDTKQTKVIDLND